MLQAHVFQTGSNCVAFLVNANLRGKVDIQFRNNKFELPARSVIILSQCNKIIFNTAEVIKLLFQILSLLIGHSLNIYYYYYKQGLNLISIFYKVTAQSYTRSSKVLQSLNDAGKWSWTIERIPDLNGAKFTNKLLDQLSTTKDATDYLWYITRYNIIKACKYKIRQILCSKLIWCGIGHVPVPGGIAITDFLKE